MTERVDPRAEYAERLRLRRDRLSKEEARSRLFWTWRRVVFTAGIALVFSSLAGWTSPLWLIPPVVIFIGLMAAHERVRRAVELATRSVAFYERGMARIEDRWAGTGDTGERFADRTHLYSEDLDLFGRGSLFELLSTTRTSGGEEMLAGWLLKPASIDEIRERQSAVIELRPRLDLREELALLGADVRASVHPRELIAWGSAPPIHFARALPAIALVLGSATFVSIILWLVLGLRWLALTMLLAELLFLFIVRQRVSRS